MVATEELECDPSEIVSPVGDFVTLIGAFLAGLFPVVLNWYTLDGAPAKPGIETVVGIIAFMCSIAVFIAAGIILIQRFRSACFRTAHSPGWIYFAGASVIFMASVLGLVVTPSYHGVAYGIGAGLILELFAAAWVGIGALLKF